MLYLIDGCNYVMRTGLLDDCEDDFGIAREVLFNRVVSFLHKSSHGAVIVFDSRGSGIVRARKQGNVRVEYADDADSRIISIVKNSKTPRDIIVVTSDNEVYNNSRWCKGRVISSEDLENKMIGKKQRINASKPDREVFNDPVTEEMKNRWDKK